MLKENKKYIYIIAVLVVIFSISYYFAIVEDKMKNVEEKRSNVDLNEKKEKDDEKNNEKQSFSENNLLSIKEEKNSYKTRTFLGEVFNDNTLDIFSNTSGKVLYSLGSEGDYINKGDLIVKVDDKYLLNDLDKANLQRESTKISLDKILNIKPDKEDFQKIDKNIEKIKSANEILEINIEKIKKDIILEKKNLDIENIELIIHNTEKQIKATKEDMELEINSTIDLLKSLYENDVEKYFVKNSNREKVFWYLIEDMSIEEEINNFRKVLEEETGRLMLKKEENESISFEEINSSIDIFFEYYDLLHHISFDILLLSDKDLVIIENKTEEGKKVLKSKKTIFNKYKISLDNLDNLISQNEKQIEKIKLGKDKVLLNLENSLQNIKNSILQNEKQIELLGIDREKIKRNYEVDLEDVDLSILNIKTSEQNIKTLKERLSDTSIYSPVSGKILVKNIDNESYINPGSFLMKIESDSMLKVKFYVPEEFLEYLKIGQEINIDEKIKARVIDIENRINSVNGKIKIEALLNKKNKNFYVGKIIESSVDYYESNNEKINIPLSAIFSNTKGENFVYALDSNKKVVKKKIRIEKYNQNEVEVEKSFFDDVEFIIKNKVLVD